MAEQFVNGHAVIVGVGADLPTTVQDAEGLANILRDSERCAYPAEQVQCLTGEQATRGQVLEAFDHLIETAADDATVVIYYSGHGYEVGTPIGKWYFLMPYGYDLENLPDTAIRGDELTERIRAIRASRILLLLDCCHAGGFDPTKAPAVQLTKAPMPAEARQLLAQGRGLVIVASSQANEKSFAGKPYSAFTLALLEALAGEGASRQDGYVRVADLALYTGKMVSSRTKDCQHPILNFEQADNFAMAYYAAGDSTPKGLPFAVEAEIETEPGELDRVMLDQRGQTVYGPQTNIIRNTQIHTGGGAYIGGSVNTGGKFVSRDDHSTNEHGSVIINQGQIGGQVAHLITNVGPQPRTLSEDAIRYIAGELLKHPPHDYEMESNSDDSDGRQLAYKLVIALNAANWNCLANAKSMFPRPMIGITVSYPEKTSGVSVLMEVLRKAGLTPEEKELPALQKVHILVGYRRNGA